MSTSMNFRIGNGYDVHRLADGLPLWLGGVFIPGGRGCVAHSDGDVLIHAICDALLGAANLRDIGHHFPDSDPAYKGIASLELLRRTAALLSAADYRIGNVDCVLCLQQPKVGSFIPQMQHRLAEAMGVGADQVSVKATTTEGLGFVGRKEGVEAHAVAMVYRGEV